MGAFLPSNIYPLNRRSFVGSVGVGFASAVLPVNAQVIKTSSDGLKVGEMQLRVNNFNVPFYFAKPQSAGKPLSVVLVISEIFGVHEYIADIARRFAHEGYFAIAPELFVRQGDPLIYATVAELMKEVISKAPDTQVMHDLDAMVDWSAQNGGDGKPPFITGFCWGGRITWLYAAHAKVRAGVAWYGRLVGAKNPSTPSHPIDNVNTISAPVLGFYGAKDEGISLDSVEQMRKALAQGSSAAKESSLVIYEEAGHAFHADYRPSYVESAAKDGWSRLLAWFKKYA